MIDRRSCMHQRTRVPSLVGALALAALAASAAGAQDGGLFGAPDFSPVGWRGFLDWRVMLESLGSLLLATALGALIAFHPMTRGTVDTLEEAELPKIYIMYAVVGAVIGLTVLEFGTVVGFVVFGLGGLMRFRTDTASARDTGRLILVTLLGLISGLNLPHFAVLAAAFAFALIAAFDAHPICRIVVKELPEQGVSQAAEAYRTTLAQAGCRIVSERKSFSKRRVEFVFRVPRGIANDRLHADLALLIPAELKGEVDWEVE